MYLCTSKPSNDPAFQIRLQEMTCSKSILMIGVYLIFIIKAHLVHDYGVIVNYKI